MISQVQAVIEATEAILEENNVNFEKGTTKVKEVLTDKMKETIIGLVAAGILQGEVVFSDNAKARHDTEAKVKAYSRQMCDNHWRKCKALNGGVDYEAKNPGSRTGSGDAVLKNLKNLLLRTQGNPENEAKVKAAIAKRQEEIAAERAAKVEVNADLIPEELRDLLD